MLNNLTVKSMMSPNHNPVANQFIISYCEGAERTDTFQSYQSRIVDITHDGTIKLYEDWDYSRTTLKYFKQFMENYCTSYEYTSCTVFRKDMKQLIKEGILKLMY